MVRKALTLAASLIVMAGPAAAAPRAYELAYFLPKTVAGVKVAQRLVSCPAPAPAGGGDWIPPSFDHSVVIAQSNVPDSVLVRLDARSGRLAKRTTELRLKPDGTLESLNASSEGQGGVVITSILQSVVKVAASFVGAPVTLDGDGTTPDGATPTPSRADPPFECTNEARRDLADEARILAVIQALEVAVAAPGATAALHAELARQRANLQQVEERLTLTSKTVRIDPVWSGARPESAAPGGTLHIPRIELERFFTNSESPEWLLHSSNLPGSMGYMVSWTADAGLWKALSAGQAPAPTAPSPNLYYRRPVPSSILVAPCMTVAEPTGRCAADSSAAARPLHASGRVSFPQLSGYFYIPLGRGGLFGSEEAEVALDASGAPVRLKYGSARGSAAIAGAVDQAAEGYATLRNSSSEAEKARLEQLRRRKEIRELEQELQLGG